MATRFVWFALIAVVQALAPTLSVAADQHSPDAGFRAFAERHCVSCHGPDVQKGRLRLDMLSATLDQRDVFTQWQRVFDRVSRGEMPPADQERPPREETQAALARLG